MVGGLLAFFTMLAVVYTWPMAAHIDDSFVHSHGMHHLGHADQYLTSWILSWGAHQLRHDPLGLFDANFAYPLPHPLALSEHMLAGALLILPLDFVHHNPVTNHNVLVLASFAIGGTGTALLVRDLGASTAAAIVAGCLFAFAPLRLAELVHVQTLSTHWMPFTLLFLQRFLRTGRWASGIAFAVTLLLTALSSVYHLYYFGIAVALFVVLHACWRCAAAPKAYRRAFVLAGLVVIALLPTMLPYADLKDRFGLSRDPAGVILRSAVGQDYVGAFLDPGSASRRELAGGRLLTPLLGIGTIVLTALGTARGADPERGGRRIGGVYLSLAFLLAFLSLGPIMRMHVEPMSGVPGPHALLASIVPGFDALRVPRRAAAPALLSLSVLAGLGAQTLIGPRSRLMRVGGGLLLVAIVLAECWRPPLQVRSAPSGEQIPPVYRWLAQQPGNPVVVEFPYGNFQQDSLYMLLSTYHWKRLVNGHRGTSPLFRHLLLSLSGFPDAKSLGLLRDLGVRYAIVHPSGSAARDARIIAKATASPHLALRYSGDDAWVFGLSHTSQRPKEHADREIPRDGLRVTTSSSDPADAVIDGNLNTHWVQPVEGDVPGWLQLDLPEARPVARLVVSVGRHFKEHLRAFRLEASADNVTWTTIVGPQMAPPPVRGLVVDPDNLTMEIALPGRPIRHLRVVRLPAPGWTTWGIHEISLYETRH